MPTDPTDPAAPADPDSMRTHDGTRADHASAGDAARARDAASAHSASADLASAGGAARARDAASSRPESPDGGRFPIDNVDAVRGPTASQAAGLTLGAAKSMMKAAMAEGRAMGVAISVAVADSGGQLVAFERMDAADLVTITLAQDKAWTAVMNRMPTRDLAPLVQPGAEFYGYESIARGRTIVFAGGMPLLRDGVLVGGVGVSGGGVEEDQRAVDAAVAAFG